MEGKGAVNMDFVYKIIVGCVLCLIARYSLREISLTPSGPWQVGGDARDYRVLFRVHVLVPDDGAGRATLMHQL